MMKLQLMKLTLILGSTALTVANAEVSRSQYADDDIYITVIGEDWHPEGLEHGMSVPAAFVQQPDILLDGKDDEPAWNAAEEVVVPLAFGGTEEARVKVLYSKDKLYFRVHWADDTEDREHHPWVWDAQQNKYVPGAQVEDSVMLSIEAGCNWNPSLLAGYQYDFDGWRWLAARSDPVGQAWDLTGNIADQDHPLLKPAPYESRNKENVWNVKFADYDSEPGISHLPWQELDRYYMYRPVRPTSWYRAEIDGMRVTEIGRQLPAPQGPPADKNRVFPQYEAVRLEGDAGEVGARGHWKDGFWTVEFVRDLSTPANTLTDSTFKRLTQFSIHVFDRTERIDEVSESGRLFLEFLPEQRQVAQD